MKRRTVLSAVAAASGAALAGCFSQGDDGSNDGDGSADGGSNTDASEDGSGSAGSDDGGNASSSGDGDCSDPCEPPSISDQSIRTTSTTCGSQDTSEASMDIEDGDVVVEGTLSASTPCHDAVLAGATIENGQLQLTVDVRDRDNVCVQCIGEIAYRTTITVSDVSALDTVRVSHVGGEQHAFDVE